MDVRDPILLRNHIQAENIIRNYENSLNNNNKITWILSENKREFYNIRYDVNKRSFYASFKMKNDIPKFNNNKSIAYIDTGYDTLFRIHSNNYNTREYTISFVKITDF